jgi:hypothetical protein
MTDYAKKATCATCPWWLDTASEDVAIRPGQCRRNPPSAQYIAVDRSTNYERFSRWDLKTFYPSSNEGGWCGHHPDRRSGKQALDTDAETSPKSP